MSVELVAKQYGLTFDEAANALANGGISDSVRQKTGKGPAKVYGIRRKNAPDK